MSWRQTVSGISSPASAAIPPAQAPAAFTTTGAAKGPRLVSTPVTRPPSTLIAVTSAPWTSLAPRSRAARMKPDVVPNGSAYPEPGS